MTIHEIREQYLEFFKKQQHALIASASLLPENDPTTLFTGSGMQPIVPYLLGEPHPEGVRLVNSQKCFRSKDIGEVGNNRHTTFFEMLGNWSLGDYFKQEQIPWVFEFLVDEIGLDPNKLFVTVFRGNDKLNIPRDTESVEVWKKVFKDKGIDAVDVDFAERDGMQEGRIFYYDETKNWWSRSGTPANMPEGEPGGPDSEIFWDFGEQHDFHKSSEFANDECHVNCDCGRFLEIGNSVFMEYVKTDGGFEPLPKKNVDFGGGLERIAAAKADDPDMFNIDVFTSAPSSLEQIEELSGKKYGENEEDIKHFRVMLDHVRAATFLIGDGALPSNKDQGYFVRRLIRRAVRHGSQMGIQGKFCHKISGSIISIYKESYPELNEKREKIVNAITNEEIKFLNTLTKGEMEFEKMIEKSGRITGNDAFILYSTYGFPLELTEEMALEKGQKVDRETFEKEFKQHQELSRAGSTKKFAGGLADHSDLTVRLHTATHMLHQALRRVLGDHVVQRGSNITPKRLRFDFSHTEKMTDEQKQEVEQIVNANIEMNLPVSYEMMSLEQAKEIGAIGVFEDKYAQLGGKIKVYFIGDEAKGESYSKEVCGGPHVEQTGDLGTFRIKKEESVGAGIRRIKAILE